MVNDKKMAMIMLVVVFFFGMAFFWVLLQVFEFMIKASGILPHFIDEGEDIVRGGMMI